MNVLRAIFFSAIMLSSNAFANDLILEAMNCNISNFLGFPVGTAVLNKGALRMTVGFMENDLNITTITDSTITGMTPGQSWDYTFQFSENLRTGTANYSGFLSQKYMMGFVGLPTTIAFAKCSVTMAAE